MIILLSTVFSKIKQNIETEQERIAALKSLFDQIKTSTNGLIFVDYDQEEINSMSTISVFNDFNFFVKILNSSLETDKTEFNSLIKHIISSPSYYFERKYIRPITLIREFFNFHSFLTDENITELSQPETRLNIFLDFISDIQLKSKGKIILPTPVLTDGGLKEDEVYPGFIEARVGINVFSKFVAMVVSRREDERYKLQDFAREYEDSVKELIINSSAYVNKKYLSSLVYKEDVTPTLWYIDAQKTSN